jgi:hypothetical protein
MLIETTYRNKAHKRSNKSPFILKTSGMFRYTYDAEGTLHQHVFTGSTLINIPFTNHY